MRKPGEIGMLVRIDNCIGCGTCQIACQEQNGLDIKEKWLESVRRYPKEVAGELRMRHVVLPEIDKCNVCAEPQCVANCPMACLFVGKVDDLMTRMRSEQFGSWQLTI